MYKMIFFIALSSSISLSMIAADSSKRERGNSIFGTYLMISAKRDDKFAQIFWRVLYASDPGTNRYADLELLLCDNPQIDIGAKCLFTTRERYRLPHDPDASPLTVAALLGDEKAAKIMMCYASNLQAGIESLHALEHYDHDLLAAQQQAERGMISMAANGIGALANSMIAKGALVDEDKKKTKNMIKKSVSKLEKKMKKQQNQIYKEAALRVERMKRILSGEVDADDVFLQSLASRHRLVQERDECKKRLQQEINAAHKEYGQDDAKS